MLGTDRAFDWIAGALAGQGLAWGVIGLAALAGAVGAALWLRRLDPRPGRSLARRLREDGESGVATLEFVLVFPVIMFLSMILLQSALAMVGNSFVHYAAFAATRAAIVQIPADYGDPAEPHNVIVPHEGNQKFDRIRAAAVFALVPVSGRLDTSDYPGEQVRDDIAQMFTNQGRTSPNWVESMVAQRVHYAARNTQVTLLEADADPAGSSVTFNELFEGYEFGPRDAVTVRVEHRLNLSVPYVRGVFADGTHTTDDGRGAYADVFSRYTLTNEGPDPNLPPLPTLPRSP